MRVEVIGGVIAVFLLLAALTSPVGANLWNFNWSSNGHVLNNGSSGGTVSLWQTLLWSRGWNGAIDGTFGPATKAETKSWQGDIDICGLPAHQRDGIVGPQTWQCTQGAQSACGPRLALI